MMKRIYENPEMKFYWGFDEDVVTASGHDDIINDMWSDGVSPQIIG